MDIQNEASVENGATKAPASHYVVVFPFSANRKEVLLIKKLKPDYLRGKWNGPGGKVEPKDYAAVGDKWGSFEAARREVFEETSIDINDVDIEKIIHMTFYPSLWHKATEQPLHIDFFAVFTDKIFKYKQMEEEYVGVYNVNYALRSNMKLVSNLYWMLPFAIDKCRTAMLYCEEVQQ